MFGIGVCFFIRCWTFGVGCSTFIFQNNPYGINVTCECLQNNLTLNPRRWGNFEMAKKDSNKLEIEIQELRQAMEMRNQTQQKIYHEMIRLRADTVKRMDRIIEEFKTTLPEQPKRKPAKFFNSSKGKYVTIKKDE